MKILFISQIKPSSGTASAELLGRHLNCGNYIYEVVDEAHPVVARSTLDLLILRFLGHFSQSIRQLYVESIEPILLGMKIAKAYSHFKFDLVLALAHGRLGLHAWRVGKRMRIPMATIFHDWWPEMMRSYRGKRDICVRAIERDFINAQMYSDLSLAVCPGMAKHLTFGKKVEVLYPIPDDSIKLYVGHEVQHPLRVVYTGSLWNPYGEMLLKLADELHGRKDVALKIHGDPKYISQQKREDLLGSGILENYIYGEPYKKRVTEEADVLLAVMGQDSEGEIRMATSFPSKVANYFQTGNVVLLWALPGSSLNMFSIEYDYPWLVESENPKEVANLLKQMATDPVLASKARLDALRIQQKVFDAAKIQQQFESALEGAILQQKF